MMRTMTGDLKDAHRPGRSACGAASRQRELERLRCLTVEERIKAALDMRARFAWIKPDTVEK